MWPGGDVGSYSTVLASYGRIQSLDSFMYYNYTSFYVMEDGSMITYAVEYSYGQSYIIKVRFTTRIISVLYMKGAIKYEIY